jgi:hypothetical protein
MLNLWGFSHTDCLFKDFDFLLGDKNQGLAMWEGRNVTHV